MTCLLLRERPMFSGEGTFGLGLPPDHGPVRSFKIVPGEFVRPGRRGRYCCVPLPEGRNVFFIKPVYDARPDHGVVEFRQIPE